jgi:hypothetical protein
MLDSAHAWFCTMDGRVYSLSIELGTKELEKPGLISIYPNPVSNVLTIDLKSDVEESLLLRIFSMDGRMMMQKQGGTQNGRLAVDISGLSNGFYILQAKGKMKSQCLKFIKN